jgi:hypothetical protein
MGRIADETRHRPIHPVQGGGGRLQQAAEARRLRQDITGDAANTVGNFVADQPVTEVAILQFISSRNNAMMRF